MSLYYCNKALLSGPKWEMTLFQNRTGSIQPKRKATLMPSTDRLWKYNYVVFLSDKLNNTRFNASNNSKSYIFELWHFSMWCAIYITYLNTLFYLFIINIYFKNFVSLRKKQKKNQINIKHLNTSLVLVDKIDKKSYIFLNLNRNPNGSLAIREILTPYVI